MANAHAAIDGDIAAKNISKGAVIVGPRGVGLCPVAAGKHVDLTFDMSSKAHSCSASLYTPGTVYFTMPFT